MESVEEEGGGIVLREGASGVEELNGRRYLGGVLAEVGENGY